MALPSSGSISMNQVRTELKKTGSISLGNADVRKLANKLSGTIKMGDLRGKSNAAWVKVASRKTIASAGGGVEGAVFNTHKALNDYLKSNFNFILSKMPVQKDIGKEVYSDDKLNKIYIINAQMARISNAGYFQIRLDFDVYKFQ